MVGPNGSGKSNISDAVRWVLGGTVQPHLRGAKMEDVIFGGTQTRRSQGYAFVSLTIDNRDRALPMEEDEVTVSRKLYRSGESEYRIGSAQVRLRDVYELFLDTGRAGRLLGHRPGEDRRDRLRQGQRPAGNF